MTAPVAEGKTSKASKGVDDAVLASALDDMAEIADSPNDGGTDVPDDTDTGETPETPTSDLETAIAEVEAETPTVAADAPTTPETPAVDPLADTAPLDYGDGKAFDGVLLDKTNGGAFILPDKLDQVRERLALSDRLSQEVEQAQGRVRDYDSLAYRWSEKDANGVDQPRELRGFQAFEKLTADAAGNSAAGLFMLKTLAEAFPGPENAAALVNVFKQAEFEHRRVSFEASQRFRQDFAQQREQTQTQAQNATGETQWMASALSQIQKALPTLTPADIETGKQFFAKRPQLVYRNATAQEAARFNVRVGERIADPEAMNEWFSERAALRAEAAKTQAQTVAATSTAGKHNAGMEKGRQPRGKISASARVISATPTAKQLPEKVSRRQAWADPLETALTEMGIDG